MRERYGPWALIAGASEGTGAAFARRLAAEGINLILVARREEPLQDLAQSIAETYGISCVAGSVDLALSDAVDRMVALADGREIGLLILNAGADPYGSTFLDAPLENWETLVMRNVMTTMRACHRFAEPMKARRRGGIMLVGSGACYGGLPGIAAYSASKAFDLVFGEALWAELKPYGVDVLNFVLGRTDTPAHRDLMERMGRPFPADCAQPDDVAAMGLARMADGPICNWGLADDEVGYAGASAEARRTRIQQIAGAMAGQEAQ